MKRLTAVTVVIMVPNFVASIYGMNFDHLYPATTWRYSFLVVVASSPGMLSAHTFE